MTDETQTTEDSFKDISEVKPEDLGLPKEAEETDKKGKTAKPIKGKKKKVARAVPVGNAYIHATYNNTIVTLTDQAGNVLSASSAGANGFKGPKKATPYAATVIVKNAVEKTRIYGLRDVNVFIKGVGLGREAAVRGLNASGLNVLTIKDVTPIPHNGCRKRKPRKV
jgi:small subunit ribosomal protein S11